MQEKQHLRLNNIKVDNIKSNWISDFHSINDMLKFFGKLSHIVNSLQLYKYYCDSDFTTIAQPYC